jgi:hypothetical protein
LLRRQQITARQSYKNLFLLEEDLLSPKLDRFQLEQQLLHEKIPYKSIQAAFYADSLRHISLDYNYRYIDSSECKFNQCINYLLLENLHTRVQNLSYFTSIAKLKDPIEKILSKVLPQRCQGRKSFSIFLQSTRFSKTELAKIEEQENKKLKPKQEIKKRQFQHTLDVLKKLVLCSILGYYPHSTATTRPCIETRIKLYDLFLNNSVWFDDLIENGSFIIEYAIRDFLVYAIPDNYGLYQHISKLFVKFDEWADITKVAIEKIRDYFKFELDTKSYGELKKEVAKCSTELLDVTYQRVRQRLGPMLIALTKSSPYEKVDIVTLEQIVDYVGYDRLGMIQRIISVYLDEPHTVINLCNKYQSPETNPKDFKEDIKKLTKLEYNVLQTIASIQHEKQRIRIVDDLPSHYLKYQVDGLKQKYDGQILKNSIYFDYCPVCNRIYSHIRDPHSVYKASYVYGYRDAIVDLFDGDKTLYCKQKHGKLSKLFILGVSIRYNNKIIFMCPECTMLMTLDTNICTKTEKGWCCNSCTKLKERVDVLPMLGKCDVCNVNEATYYYPHDVVLCQDCNKKLLRAPVINGNTKQEVIDILVKHKIDSKEAFNNRKRKRTILHRASG